MNRVLALILAGGQGDRLSVLSEDRAKPAVIFGGKYRIIDFVLSNCVNSGIFRVGILTQYRPRSLNHHIGIGRPWDLDRDGGGVFMLQPYMGRRVSDWYKGTANAVYQNLYFVLEQRAEQVLILAGDHIYKMRYEPMIDYHRAVGADVTVGVAEVPLLETSRYGIVTLDDEGLVVAFDEKPAKPRSNLASMGIYVFNRQTLIEALSEDAHNTHSKHDFGHDIIPAIIELDRVYGYRYQGYWRDVGTIDSYWQANMDLVADPPLLELYDPENVVRTRSAERPPAKLGPQAVVKRSLLSNGCVVGGYVERSVLSPGVVVEEGAVVRDSIVFDDTIIQRDAVVNLAIIDKEVVVGPGCQVGFKDDFTPNSRRPDLLSSGITVIGKRARLPGGLRIGRNCIIEPSATEKDFPTQFVASGETIEVERASPLFV